MGVTVKTDEGKIEIGESFAEVWEESRKKFDDAIYRARTGNTKTANQLWEELHETQESKGDGTTAAYKCVSILSQLTQRGQIPANW